MELFLMINAAKLAGAKENQIEKMLQNHRLRQHFL